MACCASALRAQDSTLNTPTKYCWRGQPTPACNGFLLTEFNVFRSVVIPTTIIRYTVSADSTEQYAYQRRDASWNFTWEVGGMVNTSTHTALGATLLLGVDQNGGTVGAKARYRRWLNPEGIALDIGAGLRTVQTNRGSVYLFQPGVPYREPGPEVAFTADVAINARDYVALVARVDVAKFGDRYRPNVALGVRAGSRPGVIATGAVATTYAVLFSLIFLSFNGGDW